MVSIIGIGIGPPAQREPSQPLQQGAPEKPEPGTLYISDHFLRDDPDPHGENVKQAALAAGFKGKIELREFGRGTIHNLMQKKPNPLAKPPVAPAPFVTGIAPGFNQAATADQVRDRLRDSTEQQYLSALQPATKDLNELSDGKVRNSALNISMGVSKASVATRAYEKIAAAWNPEEFSVFQKAAQQDLPAVAQAYGVDEARLTSEDPKVHGPERAKLQQALIKAVDEVVEKSEPIKKSRTEYDRAVSRFEQNNNSVVISAGNEGENVAHLEKLNGSHKLTLPADFHDSPLTNSEVTTVGATTTEHPGRKAGYSSPNREVDVYAVGDVQGKLRKNQGTSFASPRVAATMAELHRRNPQMSSAQVEKLMKQQLAPEGSLDQQRTREFLEGQTF